MFGNAFPVAELAFVVVEDFPLSRCQRVCLHAVYHVLEFHSVCSDVLHDGSPYFSRDGGQVFYPPYSLFCAEVAQAFPVDPGSDFQHCGPVDTVYARDLRSEHRPVEVSGEKYVAAPAYMEKRPWNHALVAHPDYLEEFRPCVVFYVAVGNRVHAESVVVSKGVMVLYVHVVKFS